jgi:hypothetical protein
MCIYNSSLDRKTCSSVTDSKLLCDLVYYCQYSDDVRHPQRWLLTPREFEGVVFTFLFGNMRVYHGEIDSHHLFHVTTNQPKQFLLAAGLQYEKSSRATNMVYTQMFFALGFDKLVFGTTPGVLSIIGSSLILGSAIYVAVQKEQAKSKEVVEESSNPRNDDEEMGGLVAGIEANDGDADIDASTGAELAEGEEIQLRSLRS